MGVHGYSCRMETFEVGIYDFFTIRDFSFFRRSFLGTLGVWRVGVTSFEGFKFLFVWNVGTEVDGDRGLNWRLFGLQFRGLWGKLGRNLASFIISQMIGFGVEKLDWRSPIHGWLFGLGIT